MIMLSDVAFIHVPKTAGMSFTRYLINDAKGAITISIPPNAFDHCQRMVTYSDIEKRLQIVKGTRHETIPMAERRAAELGQYLEQRKAIFTFAREPSKLIFSYYKHLQKPNVIRSRTGNGKLPIRGELKLALENDYLTFAERANFFGQSPKGCVKFFESSNKVVNDRIVIIPMERLNEFVRCLENIELVYGRYSLPVKNGTNYTESDLIERTKVDNFVNKRFNEVYSVWRRAVDNFDTQLERLKWLF